MVLLLTNGFENMECEQNQLGTSAAAIQPILIEPISSPAASSPQFESNSTGEARTNDAPSKDIPSSGSSYQMVSVNVNGVVKNLMIPVQQSASALQNVGANQGSNTVEGNMSLSTTLNPVETTPVSGSQISNMLMPSDATFTNSFENAFSQHHSEQIRTMQETAPLTSNTPSLQGVLGQPLQKICISNALKEQLLHQTSGGKTVSFQLGPDNNKKTLIFRSENAKLVGQLFQQPPLTETRIVTLDKSGVAKRIVKIAPPNNATRNIRPINIVPSNTFVKSVPVGPNSTQKTIVKAVTPSNRSSVPLSPKAPKIIIVSHPPTSPTEPAPSYGTLPLPPSVPNVCQADSSITKPLSVSSEKLCSIDSVVSLKDDHFVPVGPQSDRQSSQSSVVSTKETLRSLLKVNNDTSLVSCVTASKGTCGNDPMKHYGKVKPSQKTGVGNTSKRKKKNHHQTKYKDDDWEPPLADFDLMQWSDTDDTPVVRKIHDASVRPYHGYHSKGTSKTTVRPKRCYSMENITSCKMGCIGCKVHVKRVRKKKHQDILEKLRAKYPELKKCSVVISKLNFNNFTKLPPSTKTQVAKKSTTKSGLYVNRSDSSSAAHFKQECLIPSSETESVNSELENEFNLDLHSNSKVNQVDHMKCSSDRRVSMSNEVSQDEVDQVQDHNLSKSRYLMIKTNAGTFLVPTNSSQTPVVLNQDLLKTSEPCSDLFSSEESKDSCMLSSEQPSVCLSAKSEVNHSNVNSSNDITFSEFPKGNSKDRNFDNTEDKLALQVADEKPADRIRRLKERLKMQQLEMESARKLLESSRNVLRSIDD